jgi:hypothetical protein
MTIWITWIVCSIVFAVLFSVIKTLDRVRYAVELLDARIDQMAKSVDGLVAVSGHPSGAQLTSPGLPRPTDISSRRH